MPDDEMVELEGPDPRLWEDDPEIGRALADIRAADAVALLMRPVDAHLPTPELEAASVLLANLRRQARENLAGILVTAYGIPLEDGDEEPEDPSPAGKPRAFGRETPPKRP